MHASATAALQAPPLTDDFDDLGLSFVASAFHSATKSTPHPLTFAIFWRRDVNDAAR